MRIRILDKNPQTKRFTHEQFEQGNKFLSENIEKKQKFLLPQSGKINDRDIKQGETVFLFNYTTLSNFVNEFEELEHNFKSLSHFQQSFFKMVDSNLKKIQNMYSQFDSSKKIEERIEEAQKILNSPQKESSVLFQLEYDQISRDINAENKYNLQLNHTNYLNNELKKNYMIIHEQAKQLQLDYISSQTIFVNCHLTIKQLKDEIKLLKEKNETLEKQLIYQKIEFINEKEYLEAQISRLQESQQEYVIQQVLNQNQEQINNNEMTRQVIIQQSKARLIRLSQELSQIIGQL